MGVINQGPRAQNELERSELPASTTSTEPGVRQGQGNPQDGETAERGRESHNEEIEALRRSLQEQRRATTLLNAEVQKQTEAREALEAQLIEANAEITASWDRRKEMTRVIADRDAKIAERDIKIAELDIKIAELDERIAREARPEMVQELAQLRAEIKETRERRKEISRVVASRDATIKELKTELQARFEELAALQREVVQLKSAGTFKRLVRPLTRLVRN